MVQGLQPFARVEHQGLGMGDVGALGQEPHHGKRGEHGTTQVTGESDVAVQDWGEDKLTHFVDSAEH